MKVHIDITSLEHIGINTACLLIGGLLGLFIGWLSGNAFLGLIIGGAFGLGVAIGASITREYDGKQFHGHWCWFDILADVLGQLLGIGILALVAWLILK